MKKPKVALVHDYLVQYGGAEKTLEAICELFPDAPIYTSIYNPKYFPKTLTEKTIYTPLGVGKMFKALPILAKYFTFLIPMVFENFDLSAYDIILSDSSSYAKGVITKPNQLHISYIHTPPRFLYKYSVENTKRNSWYYKPFVAVIDHFLRIWDYLAAQRPDYLIANSLEIRNRIKKFYNRESQVIYPPVELAKSNLSYESNDSERYYLIAGRLVSYKNFDKIIAAFNNLPEFKLYIIGTGQEEAYLKSISKPNIIFLGRTSDEKKHELMANCLGLINSVKDEDFGIIPVEVLSHGKPVLAHKSAGHLETIDENLNGMFFNDFNMPMLVSKIKEFNTAIESGKYNTELIKNSVKKFSKEKFKTDYYEFVTKKWAEHQNM